MLAVFLTYTVGASKYGSPYDSSAGISSVGYFIALFVLGYIVFRVYLAIKKDNENVQK
ncbi:MAG: hypothetical protein WBM13_13580 [Bacteroidia bacterium]